MKEKHSREAANGGSGSGLHGDASSPGRWIVPHLDPVVLSRRLGDWLTRGAMDPQNPAHLLQFASVDHNGGPQVRTVVLRAADPAAAWIRFHTDIRSPKIEEIRRQPRVALLGYDPVFKLQVRMDAIVAIHHKDPLSRQGWERTPPHSRALYASKRVPGEALKQDVVYPAHPPINDLDDPAYNHFALVHCAIEVIDLLELDTEGHRRGTLVRTQGSWVWQPVTP